MTRIPRPIVAAALVVAASVALVRAQPSPTATPRPRSWIGRTAAVEAYLKVAQVTKMTGTDVGVTRPRRAYLEPGGPCGAMLWKAIPLKRYQAFSESYAHEIAAYEIDKLLALDMVPPTVERDIDGMTGAAVMWIDDAKSFGELGGMPQPPAARIPEWNRQIVRAKLFDDLIGNPDPNLGNWLVDSAWNIILIDHSRAFAPSNALSHKISLVHKELWDRMTALSEDQVKASAAAQWLTAREVRDLFERRKAMQKAIDKLVAKNGARAYVP